MFNQVGTTPLPQQQPTGPPPPPPGPPPIPPATETSKKKSRPMSGASTYPLNGSAAAVFVGNGRSRHAPSTTVHRSSLFAVYRPVIPPLIILVVLLWWTNELSLDSARQGQRSILSGVRNALPRWNESDGNNQDGGGGMAAFWKTWADRASSTLRGGGRGGSSSKGTGKKCFQIRLLTMNRLSSLQRLVRSLQAAHYDGDCLDLTVKVDTPDEATEEEKKMQWLTLKSWLRHNVTWDHGEYKIIQAEQNLGLRESWLRAWAPSSPDERGVIIEDDIELSKIWYRWLRGAMDAYSNRTDINGISLQRVQLVPHVNKTARNRLPVNDNLPFLYRLVGSIGFAPKASVWSDFLDWASCAQSIGAVDTVDVHMPDLVTTMWYDMFDKKHMWTQHFLYFSRSRILFTLFISPAGGRTLAAHWREGGAHFKKGQGRDLPIVGEGNDDNDEEYRAFRMEYPHQLNRYGFLAEPVLPPPQTVIMVDSFGQDPNDLVAFASNVRLTAGYTGDVYVIVHADKSLDELVNNAFRKLNVKTIEGPVPSRRDQYSLYSKICSNGEDGTYEFCLAISDIGNTTFQLDPFANIREEAGDAELLLFAHNVTVDYEGFTRLLQECEHPSVDTGIVSQAKHAPIVGAEAFIGAPSAMKDISSIFDRLNNCGSMELLNLIAHSDVSQVKVKVFEPGTGIINYVGADNEAPYPLDSHGRHSNVDDCMVSPVVYRGKAKVMVEAASVDPKASDQDIVKAAKDLASRSSQPFILVMQASVGMVDMVKSWLCNTVTMKDVHENTLIIVDKPGYASLKGFPTKATIVRDSLPLHLQGSWPYRSRGYWRTTQNRVNTFTALIKAEMSLLLIEPDAFWFENVYEDPDLVGDDMKDDFVAISDNLSGVGFGFLRIKASSKQVQDIWNIIKNSVDEELGPMSNTEDPMEVIKVKGEQKYFNIELKRRRKAGTLKNFRMLSKCRYPVGRWYDSGMGGDGEEQRAECRSREPRGVAVVQNNWMVGNECKTIRAKRWGHWFLDSVDSNKCVSDPAKALELARKSAKDGKPLFGPPTSAEDQENCNAPPPAGNSSSQVFEQHYSSIYRSMMVEKKSEPKFILFRPTNTRVGLGNKMRALNGAMFIAALTDRVLLIQSKVIEALFEPPIVGGLKLDWDISLAQGACNTSDAVDIAAYYANAQDDFFRDFPRKYADTPCIIAHRPYGHDRQFASMHEGTYKDKIKRLVGHGTSRFNWSKATMGLIMQRTRPAFRQAGEAALRAMGLDDVPSTHRIAVQLRTFYTDKKAWGETVLKHSGEVLDCLERLVRAQVKDKSSSNGLYVFLLSDNEGLQSHAKERLQGMGRVKIIESDRLVVHSGHTDGAADAIINSSIDWFIMGEMDVTIASGYSSYGLSAFFRPVASGRQKRLFTIDRLEAGKIFADGGNKQCGEVREEGYDDISFGMNDSPRLKPLASVPSTSISKSVTVSVGQDNVVKLASRQEKRDGKLQLDLIGAAQKPKRAPTR